MQFDNSSRKTNAPRGRESAKEDAKKRRQTFSAPNLNHHVGSITTRNSPGRKARDRIANRAFRRQIPGLPARAIEKNLLSPAKKTKQIPINFSRVPSRIRGASASRRTSRSASRGFSLYEMLLVIMLFVLIGSIAAPFTARVIKSMGGARRDATAAFQFDNAINLLRKDVWQAIDIKAISQQQVLLIQPDHRQIRWEIDVNHQLKQTDPASSARVWDIPSKSIEFANDGPVLSVNIAGQNGVTSSHCTMVCPVMLAAEGNP